VSVLVLGPLKGILIAFLLSLIDLLRRVSIPSTAVLAGAPGQDRFVAASRYPEASPTPGLLIYRFSAPLIFANANFFEGQVEDLVETAAPPVQWFVLDGEAITDIDVTGAEALEQIIDWLGERSIDFAMTRVSGRLEERLQTYGLLTRIGRQRIYASNREVTKAFLEKPVEPEVV
jgi:MFS superfamily sulfate permease-like transporter